ncbi:MAG: septation protein SepH [Propionicimonas sp.]|uniref:septation protein SepH n=1 Tax=Propionicimonas sp. TaxID=1955623 RepID=UPI003D0D9534
MTHRHPSRGTGDAVRQPPHASHLEIDMDSALTPREIQARVRSGESLEDVARAAGMGVDWVEPFAAPVIAEREFIAGQAQAHPVRRGSETIAHRTLAEVVTDRLATRKVDLDTLAWDAWRIEGRRWAVRVEYDSGSSHRDALFTYDAGGRFSVAENEDARWLLGLHSASHGPQPGRRRREEEAEPTVGLNDDLALVRVVQPRVDEPEDPNDTIPLDELDDEIDDAYAEGELAEVDGVYDIVPSSGSGLDVLYDMLSSFDEDSVQIYAGLIRAAEAPVPPAVVDDEPDEAEEASAAEEVVIAEVEADAEEPAAEPDGTPAEPEQPALLEEEPPAEPAPSRPKRKRASVPSWDEIMFGSPKNPGKR